MVPLAARAARPARAAAVRRRLGFGGAGPVALVAASLGWVATLTGLAVLAVADVWTLPVLQNVAVDATVGLAFPLVGVAVLVGSRSRARSARTTAWLLLGSGTASGLTVLTTAVTAAATGSSPVVDVALVLQSWLWVPAIVPLLTLLPLGYPDGLLPGRVWRAAAGASVAATVFGSIGVALFPASIQGRVRLEKPGTSAVLSAVFSLPAVLLLVASTAAALVSLVLRYRRSDGLRRRQVGVLLAAAAVVVADLLVQSLLPAPVADAAQAVAFALIPLALGVAITRDRLYELDLAVARTLVGVSLTGCLAGVYLTLFAVLSGIVPHEGWATAGAAGVTGLLVQPLAARLGAGVDRLFYGDRADPFAVLARMTSRLQGGIDALTVPQVLCDTVVEALRLRAATLSVVVEEGPSGRHRTVATSGTAARSDGPSADASSTDGASTETIELRYSGEVLGRLAVTPRHGEERLGPRDRELLGVLADQVAPALSAVRLSEALRRSRESLVAAREEERRRLRRDLHDGVGAALAGVRLQLESTRELVPDPRAGRLLDAAVGGVAEAVADVRRVTDDLRPPALDDLGLLGSLEALAVRFDTAARPVAVRFTCSAGPWPAAVEVACYRIAAEALSNASRHSGARTIALSLDEDAGGLRLTVVDDGTGGAAPRAHGIGLSSMRHRAEEIGGRCAVVTGTGGTTVTAELPAGEP